MSKKFMGKQLLAIIMAVTLALAGSLSALAGTVKDVQGHWAENAIQAWLDQGFINGYKDGTFRPEGKVSRAELVKMINASFGFAGQAAVTYSDVKATDWFYQDLAAALAQGYILSIAEGTFSATQPVSRLEAAKALTKLLELAPAVSASTLQDTANLSDAEKNAVGAVVDAKLMVGNGKGSFRPNDTLTRAEAVVLLTRALDYRVQKVAVYNKPGVYGPESGVEKVGKDVLISSPGVTLRNMDIQGNLTIAESVGDGDVFLKQVSVAGTTSVNGGGANSVHFENSVVVKIVVNKKDGMIRIVVEGTTEVRDVILESGAKLESAEGTTGKGFQNVTLAETLPADSKVTLSGKFETVDVLAAKINIEIPKGEVGSLNVDKGAGDVNVNLSKDASIVDLILAAVTKVVGQGLIQNADIQANGSSIEQTPKNVEVGSGVQAEVGGKPATNTGGNTTPVVPNPPTTVNKDALASKIASLQALHDSMVEGIAVGHVPFGTKASLASVIQEARTVADDSAATQAAVNGALATLNTQEIYYRNAAIRTPVLESFKVAYVQARLVYNSTSEGTAPGLAASGSKELLEAAIRAAASVLNHAGATPEQIQSGYTALTSAVQTFKNALNSNDLSELKRLVALAEQKKSVAVEGNAIGEYRAGAKAILELDLSGPRYISSGAGKITTYDLAVNIYAMYKALSKFEADKKAANPALIAMQEKTAHPSMGKSMLQFSADQSGTVYVVPTSQYPNSKADLISYLDDGLSVTKTVYAGETVNLDVISLTPGAYKMYHVNGEDNLSKPFTDILIFPYTVTNVGVTSAIEDNRVVNSVTWTDSATGDGVSYRVFRGLTSEVSSMTEIVYLIAPGTMEFVDRDIDLLPGTTYYYLIMTTTTSGNGVTPGATPVTTPSIPAGM